MKEKVYRRHIKIGGKLLSSPRFTRKKDSDIWYDQMKRKKQFIRDGLVLPNDKSNSVLFIEYARTWIKKRMANYPKSTWASDEQRLRDYLLPHLSNIPIAAINQGHVRNLLTNVIKENGLSIETRDRIKVLLSTIMSDALNEQEPLIKFNPVLGLKFKEKRVGKKRPDYLASKKDCITFLEAAKEIGWNEYAICSMFLMTGLRKQELIALRWKSCIFFDNPKHKSIIVSEKFVQTENKIVEGTKRGELISREVPVPNDLIKILKAHFKKATFKKQTDFIFCKTSGSFLHSRDISRIIETVRSKCSLRISAHGLRHTYGREFVLNTGNKDALKTILGHSSSVTTDLYSELAGDRIRGFGESVSFRLSGKDNIKRRHRDAKKGNYGNENK